MSTEPSPIVANPFSHTTAGGKVYFLNCRETKTGGDKTTYFYYFSKAVKPATIDHLPDGYSVMESNGMPILKRTVHFIPASPNA